MPTQRTSAPSVTVDFKLQKVRGAGNTGIVIADTLFAHPLQFLVVQVYVIFDDTPQIPFDLLLVLRRRRDDAGRGDPAFVVQVVAMITN